MRLGYFFDLLIALVLCDGIRRLRSCKAAPAEDVDDPWQFVMDVLAEQNVFAEELAERSTQEDYQSMEREALETEKADFMQSFHEDFD